MKRLLPAASPSVNRTPEPQSFIPGYRIRYIELETVCAWLRDNGWAGGVGFDEAVKAMSAPPVEPVDTGLRCRDLPYEAHDWNSNGSPSFCRDCQITFPRFAALVREAIDARLLATGSEAASEEP